MVRISLALLLGLLTIVAVDEATGAPDTRYLAELLRRSAELNLSDERAWHLLLHYRPTLSGSYESEADDPGFFLDPTGKTDPRAELDATLAMFFSRELVGRSQQPAQCAFVARYHWLKSKLSFDDRRLPPLRCERFEAWLAELNPKSITLIFPSAFMNNPSSMFGHTFLRIDQRGQTEQTRILAYTINYAAEVTTDNDIAYAILGVSGGFKGFFSTIPYYLKVQEYGDIENRDIWEYRLNLTEEQVRRMLMHAWELGNAYFDYFFFKENCAYHILSLLEVADPELHLTDQFVFWTIPADTIRLITAQPDLVGDIAFRPARSTEIRRTRARLSEEETLWMDRIREDPSWLDSEEFQNLPPERQAFVLDLTSDYLRYRSVKDNEEAEKYKARNRAVLVARSRLKVKPEKFKIEPFTTQPELGHKPSRIGLGGGWRNDEGFVEATIRAAYHDLLDPEPGYTPDAQIELLTLALRYYEGRDQFRVERFTLANIVSLSPMDALFRSPSWKVNASMQTIDVNDCGLCSAGVFSGGIGASMESSLLDREVFFAFAELEADISDAFEDSYRIGPGVNVGMLADLTDRWKIMASTTYLHFPLGDVSDDLRVFFGQRYTLQQNLALRFEYNHRREDDNDVLLALQA
ncbi:MAG: DUF4105 domain-containing protein, partial [Nitrospiraceae bacterium]